MEDGIHGVTFKMVKKLKNEKTRGVPIIEWETKMKKEKKKDKELKKEEIKRNQLNGFQHMNCTLNLSANSTKRLYMDSLILYI